MWRGTFGAPWRGSVANVTVQLWTLVFTFAACATMSFAATGVYEGDCNSTNTFKDPNTGETFCYRTMRITIEHFKNYGNAFEWVIAKPLCEKHTKLRFGGVQRGTTILTVNSALENEFVRNFVLAEFSNLSEEERKLALPRVLLAVKYWMTFWLDNSDTSYLAHRLGNHTVRPYECLYMSTVTRGWSVEMCSFKSRYAYNITTFLVCKARFNASTDGFAVAPLGNFRYDCVPTSEFTDGDIMPDETFCYNVTILPISKGHGYYHKLKRVCEEERSFAHDGEVKQGFLLTLNLEEEDRFVDEVLVKPFLARLGVVATDTSGRLLLGAEGKGWTDGSSSALLRRQYPDYDILPTSCRFLSFFPDRKWIVDKCTPSSSFEINVCKARFSTRTTTATIRTFKTTTTKNEYQYTIVLKRRRSVARSATLSAVVAVTVVVLLLVDADVF